MNKQEIITEFTKAYQEMAKLCHAESEETFYSPLGEKWSVAENLRHLTISSKLFSRGLNAPKVGLWIKFGRTLKKSSNYDGVIETYYNALNKRLAKDRKTGFEPKFKEDTTKAKEIEEFLLYHNNVVKALSKWSEFQINTYLFPHPLLGKLPLREFLYFMIYHTQHHHNAILKNKQ